MRANSGEYGGGLWKFWCFTLFSQKNSPHGNAKKENRIMVVIVFRFYRRIDNRHCSPLGMADAYPPLPVHVFCKGDEYIINANKGG